MDETKHFSELTVDYRIRVKSGGDIVLTQREAHELYMALGNVFKDIKLDAQAVPVKRRRRTKKSGLPLEPAVPTPNGGLFQQ